MLFLRGKFVFTILFLKKQKFNLHGSFSMFQLVTVYVLIVHEVLKIRLIGCNLFHDFLFLFPKILVGKLFLTLYISHGNLSKLDNTVSIF